MPARLSADDPPSPADDETGLADDETGLADDGAVPRNPEKCCSADEADDADDEIQTLEPDADVEYL